MHHKALIMLSKHIFSVAFRDEARWYVIDCKKIVSVLKGNLSVEIHRIDQIAIYGRPIIYI
jgi:hypothetical protein